MGRPKSHQQKIVEIVEAEVGRLHLKALGPEPGAGVAASEGVPAGGLALTADELERLEVLARVNKLIQVQLPKVLDPSKPPPSNGKDVLAALERQLHGKDIQGGDE